MIHIKSITRSVGLFVLAAVLYLPAAAQSKISAQAKVSSQTLQDFLDSLIASKDTAAKVLLNQKLEVLAASHQEKDRIMAARYYYLSGNPQKAEAISKLQEVQFPEGIQARSVAQDAVYKEKGAANTEAAYQVWISKFPPSHFITGEIDDNLIYDYVRSSIAERYAQEKNTGKAIAYINLLEVDFWKGNAYSGLSRAFYKNGDLVHAGIYAKKAMDNALSYTDGKKGDSNAAQFAASGYAGLTSTYADILFEQKKYAEALEYSALAYKNATALDPQLNYRYAQILMGLNRNQEAYSKLEEVVKAGKATPQMAAAFKTLYLKTKGSAEGFDAYAASLRKTYLENLQAALTQSMRREKAADFTLTDLQGNQVSLQDLKGKVVILDFWATWCAPCKASFPAMQMAKNKYKQDPGVKFLFIHTWERGTANPAQDAREYLHSKNYDFQVLMDLKDPETKVNKVVSSYQVKGIPAKFVIDAQGDIRFKLTGFDGSNEAAVDELAMMIEMARRDVPAKNIN